MNKTKFLETARFSLILAQARARAFRISETQIDLWSIFYNSVKGE